MKANRNLLAVLAVAVGIFATIIINLAPVWWLLLCLTLLCFGIILFIFNRRAVGWIILAGLFGIAAFLLSMTRQNYREALQRNKFWDQRLVTVEGIQLTRPEPTRFGVRFVLLIKPESAHSPIGKLTIFWRQRIPMDWYGRRLRITGKFQANPPGNGLFPEFAETQGITGSVFARERPRRLFNPGLPFPYIWANRLRTDMLAAGRKVLGPVNTRLLHGMILNDKLSNDLADRRLLNELQRTGTIHLLSVSGLHIGFLVISLTMLLGWLKVPKRWRALPLTGAIGLYIMMTGMEAPVLRAGIMMLIYMVGELFGTNDNHLNRLSLAAVILLLYNPYNLFEVSFQLSFTATLGVVCLYPLLKEYFSLQKSVFKKIWNGLLVSLGAQLLVTPLIVHYFQQISWISPLVNLLLIIPAEIVVIGGLLGEGVAAILPWLGKWILIPVDWNLTAIRWIVHSCASPRWAASWSPSWPWPWMIAYYLGLIVIFDLLRPNLVTRKRSLQFHFGTVLIIILFVFNLLLWSYGIQQIQDKYLEVSFIDVGQGDSIFLKTPTGSTILIDDGDEGKGISRVIPFLRSNGVGKLNMV